MTVRDKDRRAWVSSAVRLLREQGSWTGRFHIHKLLVVADLLGCASTPFRFELYRYGPYSFELDELIADMETFGFLSKDYERPGYGPRYSNTDLAQEDATEIPPDDLEGLKLVAREFGSAGSKDLELIATSLWVIENEGVHDLSVIRSRVSDLKRHRSPEDINQGALTALRMHEQLARQH